VQRVLELAAAVRIDQPSLFAQRIAWLRRAALARGNGDEHLRAALLGLRAALVQELPEQLRQTVAPSLDLALKAFDSKLAPAVAALDAHKPTDRLALAYLTACLEGMPQRAMKLVLDELDRGLSPTAAYTEVLLAAQKEIGELWHVGDVSVAEERIVSETTRDLMALIVAKHAAPQARGHALVAAAVTGNTHDIGLRAVADLFQIAGWRSLFLGANVPATEIARAANTFGVDLVVLNATLATQLKSLGEAIATIKTEAPGRKVLVGGLAFDGLPELWRELGADGYAATIATAVARGESLVTTAAG
jgi:methanogenic corrinoid protein MtbC1